MRCQESNRKSVTFTEEGEEEVFFADDWDRSPAAVTERLTYKFVSSFSFIVLFLCLN